MQTIQGGCQCRAVRYRAEVDPQKAYACHCSMCRHATGGAWVAYVGVRKDAVHWLGEQPQWYVSSPIAHRPFCARCGTPLGFAFREGDTMDLTLGSFDDPAAFRPTENYATESMLDGWVDLTGLPGQRSTDNDDVVRRWHAAGLEVPE
ncbi:GFA family protein [Altererythrobacter xixiisoli]|uniref:GFA family protein n=1 Tax=Croceibacterium xixiisoli TaxID=1476466 RepID=A0A6I4TW65_9SPHN|nr:GFA family protein [Croceibacterium xixiisoli]MXO99047.1 GFA family protein [Croceibacterium xixiisoli]